MINRLLWRTGARGPVLAAAVLLLSACSIDKVLEVPDPDVSRPGDLTGTLALATLKAAAVGDFQVAFAGTGGLTGLEGLVNITGLFTDEFFFTETFPTRVQIDRRAIDRNNSTMLAIYFQAQAARQSAFRAESVYAKLAPNDSGYSESLSLEGYAFILLAESYCSGVPITKVDVSGMVLPGQPLSTQQLLDSAINRFTTALTIANSAGSTYLANLALVGQARALLFKGNGSLAAAATLVQNVPSDFEYRIFSSDNTDRQNNGVFELQYLEGRWTQADKEGRNGLPFLSAGDPRTPFVDLGAGFDGAHEVYGSLKYPSRSASTVLASGVEAELILAEAALSSNYGGANGTLDILNGLRANIGMSGYSTGAGGSALQRACLLALSHRASTR
jgi:hypothetical protein